MRKINIFEDENYSVSFFKKNSCKTDKCNKPNSKKKLSVIAFQKIMQGHVEPKDNIAFLSMIYRKDNWPAQSFSGR